MVIENCGRLVERKYYYIQGISDFAIVYYCKLIVNCGRELWWTGRNKVLLLYMQGISNG